MSSFFFFFFFFFFFIYRTLATLVRGGMHVNNGELIRASGVPFLVAAGFLADAARATSPTALADEFRTTARPLF